MFNIDDRPTFTRDVPVFVPAGDGVREEKIKATYQVVSLDELTKFDLHTEAGATEYLRRVVMRLDEIADKDGNAIPDSRELRERVYALVHARVALVRAYERAYLEEKRGN